VVNLAIKFDFYPHPNQVKKKCFIPSLVIWPKDVIPLQLKLATEFVKPFFLFSKPIFKLL